MIIKTRLTIFYNRVIFFINNRRMTSLVIRLINNCALIRTDISGSSFFSFRGKAFPGEGKNIYRRNNAEKPLYLRKK